MEAVVSTLWWSLMRCLVWRFRRGEELDMELKKKKGLIKDSSTQQLLHKLFHLTLTLGILTFGGEVQANSQFPAWTHPNKTGGLLHPGFVFMQFPPMGKKFGEKQFYMYCSIENSLWLHYEFPNSHLFLKQNQQPGLITLVGSTSNIKGKGWDIEINPSLSWDSQEVEENLTKNLWNLNPLSHIKNIVSLKAGRRTIRGQ